MSIGNIKADGGINPLNEQQLHHVAQKVKADVETKEQVSAGGDRVEISERAKQLQEVAKWKGELESAPEPNAGRLNEIKSAIESGTYINDKMIQETAQIMSNQMFS